MTFSRDSLDRAREKESDVLRTDKRECWTLIYFESRCGLQWTHHHLKVQIEYAWRAISRTIASCPVVRPGVGSGHPTVPLAKMAGSKQGANGVAREGKTGSDTCKRIDEKVCDKCISFTACLLVVPVALVGQRSAPRLVPSQPQEESSLRSEWSSVLVLVVLYALQGVPLGLSMGSMCVGWKEPRVGTGACTLRESPTP